MAELTGEANESLQNNAIFACDALQQNGLALGYLPVNLINYGVRDARSIVLAAVEQNGLALKGASQFFKLDLRVVLAAVKQNPKALKYASERLKNDPRIRAAAGL